MLFFRCACSPMVYSTKPTKIEKKPYMAFLHAHLSGLSHLPYPAHLPHQFSRSAQTILQKRPNEKMKEALLESRSGRAAACSKVEKPPCRGLGACWWIGD